ncbi:MAG: NUDIX hydrolase [Actinomycetia bacterium]|nr:NUDIX hydrolase [Actinomycetes bacterium]
MRWSEGERREVHRSHWLELYLVDIELPNGHCLEHEVVVSPRDGAATVVLDGDRILMLYRHRFISDRWGWELPGGMVEADEAPAVGAAREVEEETGWRPGPLSHLATFHPSSGWSDQRFHLFLATEAEQVGEPTEENESDTIEWRLVGQVRSDLAGGAIPDGLAQFGLAVALARLDGVNLTGSDGWWNHGAPPPSKPKFA